MSVEGTWKLSVATPIGVQEARLVLRRDGDRLTGSMEHDKASLEIVDGVLDGDVASWKVVKVITVVVKVRVTATFTVTVEGDRMHGTVAAGKFGTFDVTGQPG
ncbi:hypothetical protein KZZ52_55835 [Dactylosporangium sp. AC04546]|uniref:hypothetical protein n=1 Tax=Dactylosporangium sp. AC04546 TaxID=2862460 RepID=UPI001EDEF910|nr:hypothetical protein [Dactylosporangium sp. AC04546]WVK83096.1 hypothetical protein KZZ52_55835 [Dactylosporangium sp. AC04546]